MDGERRPRGWNQQDGQGETECQEGHGKHELFTGEPRIEGEKLILGRRRQPVQNEAME
jgi:hypothetical protein